MSQLELFDYSKLAPDLRVEVKSATERIRLRMKRTTEDIIEIGKDLIAIKEKLPHGQFLPWIASEFDMSEWMAQKFMQVATRFPENREIHGLKPSLLYELASPSTPDEVVDQVIEKVENGEKMTGKEIGQLKRQIVARDRRLAEKDGEIDKWKKLATSATKKAEEQQVLIEGINTTLQDTAQSMAERIAEKKIVEVEVQYQDKIDKLLTEKADAQKLADKSKADYEKALLDFKKNPDPETQKEIERLQGEYSQTKHEVQRVTLALDSLKTKQDQALTASLTLLRFLDDFNKLISKHPDALTAMSSPYLDESTIAKVETLANSLQDYSERIRDSLATLRSQKATNIQAIAVEAIEVEAL